MYFSLWALTGLIFISFLDLRYLVTKMMTTRATITNTKMATKRPLHMMLVPLLFGSRQVHLNDSGSISHSSVIAAICAWSTVNRIQEYIVLLTIPASIGRQNDVAWPRNSVPNSKLKEELEYNRQNDIACRTFKRVHTISFWRRVPWANVSSRIQYFVIFGSHLSKPQSKSLTYLVYREYLSRHTSSEQRCYDVVFDVTSTFIQRCSNVMW